MRTIRILLPLLIAMLMAGSSVTAAMAQDVADEPDVPVESPAPPAASDESPAPEPPSPPDEEAGEQEANAPTAGEPEGEDELPAVGGADTEPASTTDDEEAPGEPGDEQPPVQEPVSTEDPISVPGDNGNQLVAAQATEEITDLAPISITSAVCEGTVRVRVGEGEFPGNLVYASARYTDVLINTPSGPVIQDWEADLDAVYTGSKTYSFHFYVRNLTLTDTTTATFQAWAPNGSSDTAEVWCGTDEPNPTSEPTPNNPYASIEIVIADCLGNVIVRIGDGTFSRSETRLSVAYYLMPTYDTLWTAELTQPFSAPGDYAFSFEPPDLAAVTGEVTLFLEATGFNNADEAQVDCTVDESDQSTPDSDSCATVVPEPTATATPSPTPATTPDTTGNLTSVPGTVDSRTTGNTGQRLSFGGVLLADDCDPDTVPPVPEIDAAPTVPPNNDSAPVVPPAKAPDPVVTSGSGNDVVAMPSTGTGTANENAPVIALLLAGMGIVLACAGSMVRKGAFSPGRPR